MLGPHGAERRLHANCKPRRRAVRREISHRQLAERDQVRDARALSGVDGRQRS